MTPFAEVLQLLRTLTADDFAGRHAEQDVLLVEPHEKGRPYNAQSPIHPGATVRFLPRQLGKPIPVGRDARAFVLLDHPAVSRLHLVLAYTPEGWKVMDRSSNGSYLDEERMPREQALPIPYGLRVRLGRALVARLFTPQGFHQYVQSVAGGFAPQAPQGPPGGVQRTADTWRMPAVPPAGAPPAPPIAPARPQPLDFQFSGPAPGQPAAPTVRFRRDQFLPQPPSPPQPPGRPGVPRAPQAPAQPKPPAQQPPKKVEDGDLEFEFDFDFDGDGRGGFA